jgi:sugar lactone lactonase YvrE
MSRRLPTHRWAAAGLVATALCTAPLATSAATPAAPTAPAKAEGMAASSFQRAFTSDLVPVGIAVAPGGRTFVSFSRAIDPEVPASVAEVGKDGSLVQFPAGFKQEKGAPAEDRLLSVQALWVDGRERLWMLDTGKVGTEPVAPRAPKLVGYDLRKEQVVKTITFPPEVAGPDSFLNDLRVDLTRGKEGVVFITDASSKGPNGIVVVDLATGEARRRLGTHPSTRPDPKLTLKVGELPLIQESGPQIGQPFQIGADGIALGPDGKHLYYAPLTSHRLYRVDAAALADPSKADAEVASTVEDLGDKGFASDGLLADAAGNVYATNFEQGAIHRRSPDGKWTLVVRSPELAWPDTLALEQDGTLLITATQIHRSPRFRGVDQRQRPFGVYRVETDSKPALHGGTPRRQARTSGGR